ncbi:pseudaminic acid synthase [Salinivibrio kushneri]|uniref:pseudaminic acid synthase n=1 Tax=Salinivibrio kushneri TaxID=1908198 RepID=UPI0009899BCE|nr:pseudaminic acid synthase [Salinivibrio kushneri]OOE36940.1 pseudaminic acid synthase [Salinivibrio kushneri]WBA10936.1 pseudaminic acid synthase [Salinivibrio kushneri]
MNNDIKIAGRLIGPQHPPYIIAEMSANHNGSLELAKQTLSMAKACGADAVKMQSYTADTITLDCDHDEFQIKGGLWDGYSLHQLYRWAQTPFEWHKPLFDHARKEGITLFSSPFDCSAIDLLEDLNAPAYKIASFEAIDLPLIRYAAQTGKPMIISTGMADETEIAEAVATARDNGCRELVLLHCISAYPAPIEQSHLRTIPTLASRYQTLAGLSDHSLTNTAAITAVALGACVIEKHVMLSEDSGGPDAAFSLTPPALSALCEQTHAAWQALGQSALTTRKAEASNRQFRRSLYVCEDIASGEPLTADNVRSIRPGFGLAPKHYDAVIGKRATRALIKGTALSWEDIED